MRLTRMAPLGTVLALQLAAQETTLEARLLYNGYGAPSFEINKPAYVALFEVNTTQVIQLYPSRVGQLHQLIGEGRTFFSPQDLAFVRRVNTGFWYDPFQLQYAAYSAYGMNGRYLPVFYGRERRALFLVGSTEPLDLGAPLTSQARINRALAAQGHHFDLSRESGLDALVALVAPTRAGGEVVSDFQFFPDEVRDYAYDAFYGWNQTYVSSCGRFGAVPVYSAWAFGPLCPSGVVVETRPLPPAPGTPGAPGSPPSTPGGGGCESVGGVPVSCGGTPPEPIGPQGGSKKITDPEQIRAFLDDMRDHQPTPTVDGMMLTSGGGDAAVNGRGNGGREASAPSVGGSRTLGNAPDPTKGPGAWHGASAEPVTPRVSAPRTDSPRIDAPVARVAPPVDRSPPRTASAPEPRMQPMPSVPQVQAPQVRAAQPAQSSQAGGLPKAPPKP